MGEFLSKDSTAIITTDCNSSVKDVYAIDINYLISNTTVKRDSEDLKYITINRKKFYIDDSAIEILYDTGKKVGIDETKLASWLLLAVI